MTIRLLRSTFTAALMIAALSLPTTCHARGANHAMIHAVENGLSAPTKIAGDPTWSIAQRMQHYDVPGMCIAVIKDNKVTWTKAYGVCDWESSRPVSTDTLFQCASISKPLSAAAAICLSNDGKIDLDADVNGYLKTWKLPANEFTADKKVTARHLISHTAGTTVHGFGGYTRGDTLPTLKQLLEGKTPANSPAIVLDKAPGKSFRYSGGGYCVLQQMMIDTEGKPFPEIMNETILGPLRMTASTYEQPLPASRQDEAAKGHLPNGKQVSGGNHVYPEMAAAGLWATAEDLAKFFIEIQLAMVGDGRTMMTPESTKAMLTPFVGKQNGLGLFLVEHGDDVYFQHGGWNEGFSSAATAHRDKGYGVVVLTNGNKPALIDEVIVSVARAYHWDNFATPEYTEQKLSKSEIANIEGRYNHAGNPVRVYLENEKMFIHPFGKSPQRLIHIGAQQFARRSETGLVCFSQDRATGMQQFAFLSPWESEPTDQESFIKLNDDEKLAADWILEGQFDKALQAFQALKENNPDDENIQEATLNNAGYALLGIGEKQMAIDTLRINTLLYPEAFNTYDSLGEAYLTNDQTELALVNYKKSVELNPNNTYAVQVIAKLSNKQ